SEANQRGLAWRDGSKREPWPGPRQRRYQEHISRAAIRGAHPSDEEARFEMRPCSFPVVHPVSIWERCEWAITVCSINPLSRATLTSSIRVVSCLSLAGGGDEWHRSAGRTGRGAVPHRHRQRHNYHTPGG